MAKKKLIATVISGLLLIIVLIVAGIFIAGQVARDRLAREFPAPGKMIVSGDHKLHVYCEGDGPSTVVLEAGLNEFSIFWSQVQSRLSKYSKACAYDRAGLGWSESSKDPATLQNEVTDLNNVIAAVSPHKPLVLVGHSYGGVLVRAYAQKYPVNIRAMILLDPTSELAADRINGYRELLARTSGEFKTLESLSSAGLMALEPTKIPANGLTGNELKQYRAVLGFGEFFRGAARETAEMYNNLQTMKQIGRQEQIRWPVVIISRGKPEPIPGLPKASAEFLEQTWEGLQADLAAKLGANRIIARQSGHQIQLSEPEVVVQTVLSMGAL